MSKVAIVFWSATGNTETMANCIAEGAGANATIIPCSEMNAAKLGEYDVVAFGCPAMGAEQLEESEFEPMFSDLEGSLNGKKVAMFGSYGWGDGQWMRDWVERAQGDGAQVLNGEGLICNEAPDEDVQAACRKLGADLQRGDRIRSTLQNLTNWVCCIKLEKLRSSPFAGQTNLRAAGEQQGLNPVSCCFAF